MTEERIELFQKIMFATNQDTIRPASYPLLDEVVFVMKERPGMTIRIEGHTDNRGNAEYNMKLSRARAKAVLEYLVAHGVSRDRLQSEGLGPNKPIVANDTPAGQDKNRRTEFIILQK